MRLFLHLPALILVLPVGAAPRVPGFDRLRGVAGDEPLAAGQVLLSELSCLACHGPAAPQDWKPGPDLTAVDTRLRPEWVRAFLADPAAAAPGTTMPDVLQGLPPAARAETVEDLVHFLFRGGSPAISTSSEPPAEDARSRGKAAYRAVGCQACHGETPPSNLHRKYRPGELAAFLRDPLRARPGGRMPSSHLSAAEAGDLAAFLAPDASPPAPAWVADPARVARGQQAFLTLGCTSCHGGGAARMAQPWPECRADKGCLAEIPATPAPRYALSPDQRAALRAALTPAARAKDKAAAVLHTMRQFDCLACHARGGLGGPTPERAVHFRSTRDDLGDLGRLPPPLDGVGRKILPEVLPRVLRGQDRARSYMVTRMPDFGPSAAGRLAALLAGADADPREHPVPATVAPNQVGRNEWGRELVGTGGYACIACHELQGHPSLGIGAYDLALMPRRLRPEWMREFLLDPAAFPTGTRMPAFWPGGKPALPKPAGGDAERQIDSIRVYLTEADQSLPPEGLVDPAAFELKPAERPLVFRTFIEGVGMHAIAVGHPGGVNLAFDAQTSRWARAWRGRFLDAAGTWHLRVARLEKPLGEPVALPDLPPPALAGSQALFRGYRLDTAGIPTFLYDLGGLKVEDRVEPIAPDTLRRTLRVLGADGEGLLLPLRAGPVPLKLRQGAVEWQGDVSW